MTDEVSTATVPYQRALPVEVSGVVESGGPEVTIQLVELDEETALAALEGLPHSKTVTRFEVWTRATAHGRVGNWQHHSQWGTEADARERIVQHANAELPLIPYPCTYEYAIVKAVAARALVEAALVHAFIADR